MVNMELFACGLNYSKQLNLEPECARTGHPCAHPSPWNPTFCDRAPLELQKVLRASTIKVVWSAYRGTLILIDGSLHYWGEFEYRVPGEPYPDNPRRKHKDTILKANGPVHTDLEVSHVVGVILNTENFPDLLLFSTGALAELKVVDDNLHLLPLPQNDDAHQPFRALAVAQRPTSKDLRVVMTAGTPNKVAEFTTREAFLQRSASAEAKTFNATIRQIATNDESITVLTETNEVHTWRTNPNYDTSIHSVALPPDTHITKIVSGGFISAALTTSGDVYIWGLKGIDGPIADLPSEFLSSAGTVNAQKTNIAGGVQIADVDMGRGHVVVLTKDGRLFSTGEGDHGQLGNRHAITDKAEDGGRVQPGAEFARHWVDMKLEVPKGVELSGVQCGDSASFVYVKEAA